MIASGIADRPGPQNPARHWLAAAFIKTVKIWVVRTLRTVERRSLETLDGHTVDRVREPLSNVQLRVPDAEPNR